MLSELVVYELLTGIAPWLGIKLWADRRYLKEIHRDKTTPLDGYLRRRVGNMTKAERAVSKRVVKVIHYTSRFRALQYLLVLAARHAQQRSRSWPTGRGLA